MSLQPRVMLCYPNWEFPQVAAGVTATVTTLTPTRSSGSWLSALPLTNLGLGKFYQPIRSTDATNASTKWDTDFGGARPLMVTALIGHNLTPVVGTSKVRVRYSNDATFATSLYDSGWKNAYQPFYAPGSLPWGWDPAVWTGGPTQMDLQHYKSLAYTDVADQLYVARYRRVEIDDTTNTMGYIQINGVFAGPGYQPRINMSTGFQLGWQDQSTVSTSEYGVQFSVERPRRRQASLVLDMLSVDQGFELPFEMHGRLGTVRELFFIVDPTSLYHMHRGSFPAYLSDMNPLEWPYSLRTQHAVKLIEKL